MGGGGPFKCEAVVRQARDDAAWREAVGAGAASRMQLGLGSGGGDGGVEVGMGDKARPAVGGGPEQQKQTTKAKQKINK